MAAIARTHGARAVQVAADAAESARLAAARRTAFSALARVAPTTILEDATVPRSRLVEMVRFIEQTARTHDLRVGTFGHMGDGNLHPTFLTDERNHAEMERVERAMKERALQDEVAALRAELYGRRSFQNVLSKSPKMIEVFDLIGNIAQTTSTVLIIGETGTGKEQVARAIHQASAELRRGQMVAVNCAAIPETLLESELFGHEKGSFTGAISQRKGRFEQAHKGTLFLDEVGDIPLGCR